MLVARAMSDWPDVMNFHVGVRVGGDEGHDYARRDVGQHEEEKHHVTGRGLWCRP